jgi:ubiquinone/menaquinone biosynthesis C-methylase UbiE
VPVDRAFSGNEQSAARWYALREGWWEDHFVGAVDETIGFFSGDGISLEGAVVLDLGCGDGVFALGLSRRTGIRRVIAVDVVDIDEAFLKELAASNGVDVVTGPFPEFVTSRADSIPLPDASVDFVVTWSVFEHVDQPDVLLREVRRVLKPQGLLFVQIWPLYFSEHGSHLWPFFDTTFAQLRLEPDQIRATLETKLEPSLANAMFDLYLSCNRITVDELQAALLAAGFQIAKVELMHNAIHVPPGLRQIPLSSLAISGIKLLAYPTSPER